MPTNPVPLREALREAVEVLVAAEKAYQAWGSMANAQRAESALVRVRTLIDQIPIVFEAREGDGQ
jgi:hypothetical protein